MMMLLSPNFLSKSQVALLGNNASGVPYGKEAGENQPLETLLE